MQHLEMADCQRGYLRVICEIRVFVPMAENDEYVNFVEANETVKN